MIPISVNPSAFSALRPESLLKVDPERAFTPALKREGLGRSRMGQELYEAYPYGGGLPCSSLLSSPGDITLPE
jgi:hypothetical protein